MIQNPPSLQQFTTRQIQTFLSGIAEGHSNDIALHLAGLLPSHLSDLLVSLPPNAYEQARLQSKIPLANVRTRMNNIMSSANDPEDPMPPALALDILERQDPTQWGKRTQIELKPPEPSLPPEERERLHKLFALPAHAVTPNFIEGHVNEKQDSLEAPASTVGASVTGDVVPILTQRD